MYYLEELEKDGLGYINYCKEVAKKYFIDFFGKNFSNSINDKIDNTPIIFVKEKNPKQASLKNIDFEYSIIMLRWFGKFFDSRYASSLFDVGNKKINELSEYVVFSPNNEENRKKIKEIISFLCPNEEINVDFDLIEKMKDYYIKNVSPKKLRLLNVQLSTLDEKNNKNIKYKNYDDLKKNIYINHNFNNLTFYQKDIIFTQTNNFLKDKFSYGRFHSSFNYYNKNSKFNACFYSRPETLTTVIFIHELLHVVSNQDIEYVNQVILKKSGLSCLYYNKIDNISSDKNIFLNEVCTDYFADIISINIFKDKKESIFLLRRNSSLYSYCFVLVKDFFDKHLELLKNCYLIDDISKINTIFGKRNLQQLNSILFKFVGYYESTKKHNKNFKTPNDFDEGLKIFNSLDKKNISNSEYKYYECFDKIDKLTKKFEEKINIYNQNNVEEIK